jgi:phosphatidylserine/phosphatidylglycerophosphate/cardiolipin synthase-like enzyme
LLEQRVDAVGPGGCIDWMTYYFRDEGLADALIRAHRRGAVVRVSMEGSPRRRHANDAVIRRLQDPVNGIGGGLRAVRHAIPLHLHAKIYCFSDPEPHALVGSFNPSGSQPGHDAILADIGDHDCGHNLLIELNEPEVVEALVRRTRAVHEGVSIYQLMSAPNGARVAGWSCDGVLFPYFGPNPLDRRLNGLQPGAELRIAASHVRDPHFARVLRTLSACGVEVSLLTHHTLRRTPRRIEAELVRDGVRVFRYEHPAGLPMHCKFMLVRDGDARWAAFGSYNLTATSRWLNQELLAFSSDRALWSELDRRWREILDEPHTRPCTSVSRTQWNGDRSSARAAL